MFFAHDFETNLTKEEAGAFGTVLEMVRIAPSALNKQPWRIVKSENQFHFYIDGKMKFAQIDIGIAMCHFELAAKELGFTGQFVKDNPGIHTANEYVATWIQRE